ncbi:MAG TPA: DUF3822 family protein [Chitinophagaceae bacterium]|nr:DUF3822 family protein [Chitinophagaceae bacterium]
MITLIKILPQETEHLVSAEYHLLLLLGNDDWQFVLLNKLRKQISGLLIFHFEKNDATKDFKAKWDEIISDYPFLDKYFSSVTIAYNYDEAMLLPDSHYDTVSRKIAMDTLYGEDTKTDILNDFVADGQITVVYRIPTTMHRFLQRNYINASHRHYYSLELDALDKGSYEDIMTVNFFNNRYVVKLTKKGCVQLIQTYPFKQPEDVLFYLLAITEEFGCNREEIALIIGGMVDEISPVFLEIRKYFLNAQLAEKPESFECGTTFNGYPVHYFNPAFTMVSCVL